MFPASAAVAVGAPATEAAEAPSPGGAAVAALATPLVGCGASWTVELIRAITWPTVTVSPSSARISVIWPEAGAGSSMSTLSVESSTTVSPCLTASPTFTDHSRIVPSVTDSPPAGVTMSIVWPALDSVAATPSASVLADAAASARVVGGDSPETGVASAIDPPPLVEISASTPPTATVSPSATWSLTIVPATGEGTSASTLSVDISTSVSSASMLSPSCLCHSRTVPSATESPISGMTTSTVVLTAAIYYFNCNEWRSVRRCLAGVPGGAARR